MDYLSLNYFLTNADLIDVDSDAHFVPRKRQQREIHSVLVGPLWVKGYRHNRVLRHLGIVLVYSCDENLVLLFIECNSNGCLCVVLEDELATLRIRLGLAWLLFANFSLPTFETMT